MTSAKTPHALITGGAGYIGSLLTGVLLNQGWSVTVVDDLLFGGASLLGYWHHPRFRFAKGDICDPATLRATGDGIAVGDLPPASFDAVIHLAAIVGFPACQMVGPQVAWRYNFEGTKRVFAAAEAGRVARFVFASTYSNYGLSPDGKPVTEESPLNPQSLYAETKIAAEQFLRENTAGAATMPILFRFATLFGVSPRTRFDLIINQFVLEAITRRKLIIYQRGYARSFVHVRDVCDAILLGLEAPATVINREIFNVGSDEGNYTKDEIVALVQRHVEGTVVEYKDLTFGGDMRDIRVSFAKIRERLGFRPRISVEQGIREVASVLTNGVIKDALDSQYRNAQFIVQ
ncbi:NAD-dependent epimerase/dehydratase family protein [Chloroflexus sp.]|uniref:NAD-dependent epimerase/dehydratase family protein n=1 Tax=Chloroflexus sp. TaxID=1904827 RepID=UPI00404B8F45